MNYLSMSTNIAILVAKQQLGGRGDFPSLLLLLAQTSLVSSQMMILCLLELPGIVFPPNLTALL